MARSVTWLHVSDLHARTCELAEQKRCWKALARDIGAFSARAPEHPDISAPDLIFISGDVAQSGAPAEYRRAREALRRICDAARVPMERVFIVPGNHDIDRSAGPTSPAEVETLRLVTSDPNELRKRVDNLWESTTLRELTRKFGPFLDFMQAYAPVTLGPLASWTASVDLDGTRCELKGFNSAWNGGTRGLDAPGVPLVGVMQREALERHDGSSEEPHVCCVLQHHPTEYLNVLDGVLHDAWLGERDAVVFSGHIHSSQTAERRSIDGRHVQIIGGALYSGYPSHTRRYSLGTLGIERSSRSFAIELRKQADHGGFTRDTERYRSAPEGRIRFLQSAQHRILGDVEASRETVPDSQVLRILRDWVSLRFEDGYYMAKFEKRYRNDTPDPWTDVPARIIVNAFPDDLAGSRAYYHAHPFNVEDIEFHAESEGQELEWKVVHDHDASKEVMLRFENGLSPGETRDISYTFRISSSIWGPYLERHVRIPTELVGCELDFPESAVSSVWAVMNPHIRDGKSIEADLEITDRDARRIYRWSREHPKLHTRYRLRWTFAPGVAGVAARV
jgi:hypothetical protein